MQKFIKLRSPSRQLLETVNFAFMKIFDSLAKIAVFRASLTVREGVSVTKFILSCFSALTEAFWYAYSDGS